MQLFFACVGIGLALLIALIGFWLIATSGEIEDTSMRNLSRIGAGLLAIIGAVIIMFGSLNVLDGY